MRKLGDVSRGVWPLAPTRLGLSLTSSGSFPTLGPQQQSFERTCYGICDKNDSPQNCHQTDMVRWQYTKRFPHLGDHVYAYHQPDGGCGGAMLGWSPTTQVPS